MPRLEGLDGGDCAVVDDGFELAEPALFCDLASFLSDSFPFITPPRALTADPLGGRPAVKPGGEPADDSDVRAEVDVWLPLPPADESSDDVDEACLIGGTACGGCLASPALTATGSLAPVAAVMPAGTVPFPNLKLLDGGLTGTALSLDGCLALLPLLPSSPTLTAAAGDPVLVSEPLLLPGASTSCVRRPARSCSVCW